MHYFLALKKQLPAQNNSFQHISVYGTWLYKSFRGDGKKECENKALQYASE